MYKLYFILIIGTAPGILQAQNNRISVQTGLFHCFFDNEPLMNVNSKKKQRSASSGLLYNSLGIQYTRKINAKNSISAEAMYFHQNYGYYLYPVSIINVNVRVFYTFNLNYDRHLPLSKHLDFTYGGGINYRSGNDWVGYTKSAHIIHGRSYKDIGVNLRTGIEYSPWRWLTLYTKFDLLGFVYLAYKEHAEYLQSMYNVSNYPNRFDLSWRFGLGFNFGKVREEKTGL